MTVAATTGPTPKIWVSVVPGRPDRHGELLLGLAELGVDTAQVLGELGGELAAGRRHRPDGDRSRTRAA